MSTEGLRFVSVVSLLDSLVFSMPSMKSNDVLGLLGTPAKKKQKRKINIQKLEPKDFGIHHYRISEEAFLYPVKSV